MQIPLNTPQNLPVKGTDLDVSSTETKNKRVLIIDDEPDMLRLMKVILMNAGFDTATAISGADGLRRLEIARPDVILLDVMMPEADGFVIFEELRSITDIPIIFVSAKSEADQTARVLEEGKAEFIAKPFHIDELVSRIKRVMAAAEKSYKHHF